MKQLFIKPMFGANNLTTLRVVKWPNTRGTWHAVINNKNALQVIDLTNGAIVYWLDFPLHYLGQVLPIRLASGRAQYLAIAQASNRRMVLSVFGPEKKLIYEETLRGGVNLTALPANTGEHEILLVSECGKDFCGKVWRYSLKIP